MAEKAMREGYTTGSTATAAMKAALLALRGEFPPVVTVRSPQRQEIRVPIEKAEVRDGIGVAVALKDGGDDLDCTHQTPVVVTVQLTDQPGLVLKAGKGVGTVTKPGLQVPVGHPAINPGPQIMMRYVYEELAGKEQGCIVTISVPAGEELAAQTLNPALGVIGGISIIGTTGIVKPMSEEAYKHSLTPQLSVTRAAGHRTAVLVPGRIGENAAMHVLGIPRDFISETSNFIGYMMEQAVSMEFQRILIIGHTGKLVKIASGSFHTYNRVSDGRMETLAAYAALNGAKPDIIREILDCGTTDGAAEIIRREGLQQMYPQLAERAQVRGERYIFGKAQVGVIFVSMDGKILASSSHAEEIARQEKWNIH